MVAYVINDHAKLLKVFGQQLFLVVMKPSCPLTTVGIFFRNCQVKKLCLLSKPFFGN